MTRPYLADPEQVDQDELAERRRERDRQREAGRRGRVTPDLTRRHAFQAGVVASVGQAVESSITAVQCPVCLAPVFAPGDSDRERVDCFGCDARLVTRQGIEGLEVVPAPDGAS